MKSIVHNPKYSWPVHFWLVSIFLCISSCTVQKSASVADNGQSKTKTQQEVGPSQQADGYRASEGKALKIDYLTPIQEIRNPSLVAYKDKRGLYVIYSGKVVRDYPVGLGSYPRGDKERDGDHRTPEGEFFVCAKNPGGPFSRSLGISYPTRKHAEKGAFERLISPAALREILQAQDKKLQPPWNTPLGGDIFIHGGGAHSDWTEGSIALYDSDMKELFDITQLGTPVHIRP
jgi:hypothetical protein